METRLYFLIGDIVSNGATGAVVAMTTVAAFDERWPVLAAMVAGSVLGTVVAMPIAMVASVAFGAFEVLLPVTTTGMLVGMLAAPRAISMPLAAGGGALVGLGVLVLTYALNAWVRRHEASWTV